SGGTLNVSKSIAAGGSVAITGFTTANLNADISIGGGNNTISGNIPTINVLGSANGAQIQDAIYLLAGSGTINVSTRLYNENLTIGKSLTLNGNFSADAVDPAEGATPYPAPQPGAGSSNVVVIRGNGSAPLVTITDGGGGSTTALNVTLRGLLLDGNGQQIISA